LSTRSTLPSNFRPKGSVLPQPDLGAELYPTVTRTTR
jgi:hypothetical protein